MAESNNERIHDVARYAEETRPSMLGEMWEFIRLNKKWWLMPIIVVLLFLGLLTVLGGTAAAPFIYTIF